MTGDQLIWVFNGQRQSLESREASGRYFNHCTVQECLTSTAVRKANVFTTSRDEISSMQEILYQYVGAIIKKIGLIIQLTDQWVDHYRRGRYLAGYSEICDCCVFTA